MKRNATRALAGPLTALALAALPQAPRGADDPPPLLVEHTPQAERRAAEGGEGALADVLGEVRALRVGRATPEAIVVARAVAVTLPGSGETLVLDDIVVEPLRSGHAVYTRDQTGATSAALVVIGQDVTGTIRHRGEAYGVHPLGGGSTALFLHDEKDGQRPHAHMHPNRQANDTVVPEDDAQGTADANEPGETGKEDGAERRDDGRLIDVLVVYSKKVGEGTVNPEALAERLVLYANLAYANSGIETRLRLVHTYETGYEPLSEHSHRIDETGKDLDRLTAVDDGHADEVHDARDRHGADIVVMLWQPPERRCGHGLAYVLDPKRRGIAEVAFAAMGIRAGGCEGHGRTFAHEVGHLQGALHNPEEFRDRPVSNPPFTYGFGFCNAEEDWLTIMAYPTDWRCNLPIPHFSNPDVLYEGVPTGDHELRNVARAINEMAPIMAKFRRSVDDPGTVTELPLVLAVTDVPRQSFVRVINESDRAGEVTITAFDDEGSEYGPLTLALDAGAVQHFNSKDLEAGNPAKRLTGRTGDGTGHWRLKLETGLKIEALTYIRTADGFVAPMHDVAPETAPGSNRYRVRFFNQGKNVNQRSLLRLVNPGHEAARIVIEAVDDRNDPASGGAVALTLEARSAAWLSAHELEKGADGTVGRFGTGRGKWRLTVSADRPVRAMSLLALPTGHLTNLSQGH